MFCASTVCMQCNPHAPPVDPTNLSEPLLSLATDVLQYLWMCLPDRTTGFYARSFSFFPQHSIPPCLSRLARPLSPTLLCHTYHTFYSYAFDHHRMNRFCFVDNVTSLVL